MPPGPVYLLVALGSASVVIGISLAVARIWPQGIWRAVLPAGRMTLSLYLAHIVIGMGVLDEMGALNGTRSAGEAAGAAALFMLCATVSARLWSRRHPHGPVEALMRRVTGSRKALTRR